LRRDPRIGVALGILFIIAEVVYALMSIDSRKSELKRSIQNLTLRDETPFLTVDEIIGEILNNLFFYRKMNTYTWENDEDDDRIKLFVQYESLEEIEYITEYLTYNATMLFALVDNLNTVSFLIASGETILITLQDIQSQYEKALACYVENSKEWERVVMSKIKLP
jgi:hypothetical protein